MASPAPVVHQRNKSTSMLKGLVTKSHKRSATTLHDANSPNSMSSAAFLLPLDHPHSQLRTTNRTQPIPTNAPASPQKSQDGRGQPARGLHKKTLSTVSLRSVGRDKEKKETRESRSREPSRVRGEDTSTSPKKIKSSANLTSLFRKNKQTEDTKMPGRDKENTTPPSTSNAPEPVHTPIWAQFSSQPLQETTSTTKVPLNDQRRSIEEQIAIYSAQDYSPSKQRNFFEYGQPALQKKPQSKERPKSQFLPTSGSTASLIGTFTGRKSTSADRVPLGDTKGNEGRVKETKNFNPRGLLNRASSDYGREASTVKTAPDSPKKQNRVMAAVAAFNGKSKATTRSTTSPTSPVKLDPKVVDAEFESVLESRNIPTHQRAQMRTLKLEVKADFVRTHKLDIPSPTTPTAPASPPKPTYKRASKSHDGVTEEDKAAGEKASGASVKRERPRSRTFNFTKGDSPIKKQKGDAASTKSLHKTPSSRSLASISSQRSVSKGSKNTMPAEFIQYLKNTPKPQEVEVGKLHKLRLLLRNETVQWVNSFVEEGGMTELVGLLHRILEVEWREDHEDTLLHELLRCLKGLCTTDSALKQFADMSSTLFPALLAMLFDEEHKGPSEFTTRELIIQIIFAHLDSAPKTELSARATELIKYLKDPIKEKESSTVPFILQMHQPRPYQVWCKEITNVTKEVFWIFIHHLNVIPLVANTDPSLSYTTAHFPGPRAIVPAAPYVGGVEWDATNYLATHLDLLNGILASIPGREDRNTFRSELKVSGFEKVMGHLRTCNPKYYGAVHDALKVWTSAAAADAWEVRDVRMGPSDGKPSVASPVKQSPTKKKEPAPQIQAPKMDLGSSLGLGFDKDIGKKVVDDDWN
ncbi:hypothetical protein DM02DRAFT_527174 [Periconia macrospinosa]|uniref:Formin GTPase-binding domain-containing protein n=1 Tax=Periconia macrospinosa TaxID=97972 RepID=A0A2V1DQ24_9PLEO|nr:hypothetical protein DM02DRAFT_527174 [Periconia macrospinosa]